MRKIWSLRTALLSAVNSRVFSLTLFTDSSSRCRWARRRRAAACGVSLWLIHHVWLDSHASSLWSVTKVLLHFFVHPVSYITTAHTHSCVRVCCCISYSEMNFFSFLWISFLWQRNMSLLQFLLLWLSLTASWGMSPRPLVVDAIGQTGTLRDEGGHLGPGGASAAHNLLIYEAAKDLMTKSCCSDETWRPQACNISQMELPYQRPRPPRFTPRTKQLSWGFLNCTLHGWTPPPPPHLLFFFFLWIQFHLF